MSVEREEAVLRKKVAAQIAFLNRITFAKAYEDAVRKKQNEKLAEIIAESGGIKALADAILSDEEKEISKAIQAQAKKSRGKFRFTWRHRGASVIR